MNSKHVSSIAMITLCCAGLAMGQTVWTDHPDNPVVEPGDPGAWAVGGPWIGSVVFDGTTFHMYFTGTDEREWIEDTGIGHATSPDGVDWTMDPANPVITAGESGQWDDTYVAAGAVIHDGTGFHMWYTGYHDDPENVGYATSPDGSTWTKHPGNPVMLAGAPGSWDDRWVAPTAVIAEGGAYKMWYAGNDGATGQIGYAESSDGMVWVKHSEPVLEPGDYPGAWTDSLLNPSVVFDGVAYHMWFVGDYPNVALKVGYAFSDDGIEWTQHRENPVVVQVNDENIWGAPVLFDGATWHMWYSHDDGVSPSDYRISYSTSECCAVVAALDHMLFIPAAAVASGSQGAFYQTDVDVSNADDQAGQYQFAWLPRGESNAEPTTSETFSLGANMSVRYSNVLTEVFGLEPNSLGALMVLSSSEDLLFMSRTYNNPSGGASGTFGQAIPAIPAEDFIRGGEKKRIVFGSENAESRFNVGCQNGGDGAALVSLELFAADGTSLESKMMILGAWSNDQLNRIFEDYRPINGSVDVWASGADSSFYCYGSLLDNTTSDPTTIPPQ